MRIVLACCCLVLSAEAGLAQDLAITDARIVDGTGLRIDRGAIVIRGGRIESVTSGTPDTRGLTVVDAGGLTALPGYIDAHRHIIRGDAGAWLREESAERMREFLEAGFTTLLSGGGPDAGILELERRVRTGALQGPRIVTSARDDPPDYPTPQAARARVREIAAMGIRFVKVRIDTPADAALLAEITDEAAKLGLEVMVHAVTVPVMHAAIDAGATKLVHTPHGSYLTPADARRIADAGIENLSTVGFAVPVFGVFNRDNVPTFRDGSDWPDGILGTGSNAAGEKIVNGRTMWDAGVVYGFGTDTDFDPREGLRHELRALTPMFSPLDVLELMGPNTAAFINRSEDLGTLETGKIADIVLVDGDPLDVIFELLDVEVVIQGGRIVVDKR